MQPGKWLWALGAVLVLSVATIWATGQPHLAAGEPLDLEHNGVHAPYNVRNAKGELMLFNFRAVEPGLLYRGSGFPRNKWVQDGAEKRLRAAALQDGQLFDFMRARNIHRIITLQEVDTYYAEKGYFEFWERKAGYPMQVQRLSVRTGHAYDRDEADLLKYPALEDRRFGLRAAAEFIHIMKFHNPKEGAVYLHCDAGKDRTGVVVAAYELWRNRGTADRDTLWRQVMERYLVSNVLIARDAEAGKYAGLSPSACPGEDKPNYVCRGWLEPLRRDLERIAQL